MNKNIGNVDVGIWLLLELLRELLEGAALMLRGNLEGCIEMVVHHKH